MTTKKCTKCGAEKMLDEYYAHPQSKDGKRPECKQCHSDRRIVACPNCQNGTKRKDAKQCSVCYQGDVANINVLTGEQIAWIAGILEGEGTWVRKGANGVAVRVQMTDMDIIERLHKVTGVGSLYFSKRQKSHHKDTWIWHVGKKKQVTQLTSSVLPWMGKRRKAKISDLLGL